MGCLCTHRIILQQNNIVRSGSYSADKESAEICLSDYLSLRNFYGEYKLKGLSVGAGLVGEIRLCTNKSTNKTFAVKIIPKSNLSIYDITQKTIENQVRMIQSISHPSIMKIHDFFEDSSTYYLVMDYISGGDLFSKLEQYGRFSEKTAAKIMKQVFSALAYLHSKQIVHRDIKCENLLLEESKGLIAVKLIDFDTVTKIRKDKDLKGLFGTVYYMAPEVVKGEYNEKCDLWSAGIVLYSLITQKYPFGGSSDNEIMQNISKNQVDFSLLSGYNISKELHDMIRLLLDSDPLSRISALEALGHPWIAKYCRPRLPSQISLKETEFWTYLKFALKMWIIQHIIPSYEVVDIHLLFIYYDKNADGVINKEELAEALKDEELIEKIMAVADWNSNGVLEYYEFLSIFVNGSIFDKYSEEIFKAFDTDSKGKISVSCMISFLEYSLEGAFGYSNLEEFGSVCLRDYDIINLLKG